MRKPRMLIFYDKKNIADIPFCAVFYTDNDIGNEILRTTEDSHHKKWNFENHPKGKEVKKEIKKFIESSIRKVCTNDVEDEFEIAGTSLLSFGKKRSGGGMSSTEIIKEATVSLYPGPLELKDISSKNADSWIISKEGIKKKIEPKKPKYKKRDKDGSKTNKSDKKREYYVNDFKPSFFKNDSETNEYHFFVESDIETNVRKINFAIKKAEDVRFISQIIDPNGKTLSKDVSKEAGANTFENFDLSVGLNKFIIKTLFDKKLEILIN